MPRSLQEAEAQCRSSTEKLTLPLLLERNAKEYADVPALTAGERTLTWAQLREEAAAMSRGLAAIGLGRGERMMIMLSTRVEHWTIDFGAAHLGAVPCTAYQTLSAEQVAYVAKHSGATVAVLEGASEVARWWPALESLPALRRIVVLDAAAIPKGDPRFISWAELEAQGRALHAQDPRVFDESGRRVRPDDPIAMMYTSGTTGEPKGVVLSHRNAFYEAVAVDAAVTMPQQGPSIAYLPLAHIAERELGFYRALYKGLHVNVSADPAGVIPLMAKVRPPAFFGVPRVWEKLASGLRAKLGALEPAKRDAILGAHALAREAFVLEGNGKPVPPELAQKVAVMEEKVLRPVRALIGMDAMQWASSGSAPIPVDVLEYLGGFGIRVMELWGMSETTGCATLNTLDEFRIGSVGRPIAGVEVKLAADGEIFVRGPIVFLGYLDASGEVKPAVDAEGWLATGDIGTLDADGYLTITDRKKELIITSHGKNIAPSKIEGLLRAHPLVGQAIAIGDGWPYVTALISLDEEAAPVWAKARGLAATTVEALSRDPAILAELETLIAASNARLSRAEQVKRYEVLPEAWSPDKGQLTPTLKLKRRVILQQYAARIGALYAQE